MGLNFKAIGAAFLVLFVFVMAIVCTASTEKGWFKKDFEVWTETYTLNEGTLKYSNSETDDTTDIDDSFEDNGKAALAMSVLSMLLALVALISVILRLFSKGPDILSTIAPASLLISGILLLVGALEFLISMEQNYEDDPVWKANGKPDVDYAPILGIIGGIVGIIGGLFLGSIRSSLSYDKI